MTPNLTRQANATAIYRGEVLVNYEASTHFFSNGEGRMPDKYEVIREDEINAIKA